MLYNLALLSLALCQLTGILSELDVLVTIVHIVKLALYQILKHLILGTLCWSRLARSIIDSSSSDASRTW